MTFRSVHRQLTTPLSVVLASTVLWGGARLAAAQPSGSDPSNPPKGAPVEKRDAPLDKRSAPADEQSRNEEAETKEPPDPGNAEEAKGTPTRDATGTPTELGVRLTLQNTEITREAVVAALQEEFGVPILAAETDQNLVITVDGQSLLVSYRDGTGPGQQREAELPNDRQRQLDVIALMAGNVARDEASALLAEMRARYEATQAKEEVPPPPLPTPEEEEPSEEEQADGPKAAPPPPKEEESKPPEPQPETAEDIESTEFSASFTGKITYPKNLEELRTHIELGAFYSDVGALEGAAITLIASRIRGLGREGRNSGAQLSLAWARNDGAFDGAIMTTGASLSRGTLRGAQGAVFAALQEGNVEGAQLSAVVSLTEGDIVGGQLGGAAAILQGDLLGGQLAIGAAYARSLTGAQLALVPVVETLKAESLQLGLTPVSYGRSEGWQLGVVNTTSEFFGTQIGLVNVAGRGKGTQVGLFNYARENEGKSIGAINVVPNQRIQAVTYASYAPPDQVDGLPSGILGHAGVRFLPEPIYTQLAIGFGPGVDGGSAVYAPSFALGVRSEWGKVLFGEFDLSYQFEGPMSGQDAHRHGALLRAALGAQLSENVALILGGGPRLNFISGGTVASPPEITFAPHAFGGLAFF